MNQSASPHRPLLIALLSLAELVLVTAGTFGLIYGLKMLADYRAQQPIPMDASGTVVLAAPQATLQGRLQLTPRVLEEQQDGYSNGYGRALAKERLSRTVSQWAELNDSVSWRFQAPVAGEFRIEVECAADSQNAGGEFEVSLGDQHLTATVPDTGGAETWQVVPVGQLRIAEPGTVTLSIKPTKLAGKTLMGLKSVVVRKA